MAKYRSKTTFNVPATAGLYAPERVTFDTVVSGGVALEIDAFTALATLGTGTPATGAISELWLPPVQPSARPVPDAEYVFAQTLVTGAGAATVPLVSWRGAQVRVKSGGTAGTVDVSAVGD